MAFFGAPEVRAENESVLQFIGVWIRRTLRRATMKHGENRSHFFPVVLQHTSVGSSFYHFTSQGHFPEGVVLGPVEIEVAVEPADGVLGAVSPVESDARYHDIGRAAFDHFTHFKFGNDVFSRVSEFEGVKSSPFWWSRSIDFGRIGEGMVFNEPCLIYLMKLSDGEADDAASFFKGNQISIVRDVVRFKLLVTLGAAPESGFEADCGRRNGQ